MLERQWASKGVYAELSWYDGPVVIGPRSTLRDNFVYMGSLNADCWGTAVNAVHSVCERIPVPLPVGLADSRARLELPSCEMQAVDAAAAEAERRGSGRMWTRGVRRRADDGVVQEISFPAYTGRAKQPRVVSYRIRSQEFHWMAEKRRCLEAQETMDWARDVLCALRRDGLLVTGESQWYRSGHTIYPWDLGSP